jgi:hypothetical protein
MASKMVHTCDICGEPVGYDEILAGDVMTIHTPETRFTNEATSHLHKKCLQDEADVE